MDEIKLTTLKRVFNEKGDIFHVMKKSDEGFNGFGEAYFSSINKNTIKGWKKHTLMTLNIVVPIGEIEFVVFAIKAGFYLCLAETYNKPFLTGEKCQQFALFGQSVQPLWNVPPSVFMQSKSTFFYCCSS